MAEVERKPYRVTITDAVNPGVSVTTLEVPGEARVFMRRPKDREKLEHIVELTEAQAAQLEADGYKVATATKKALETAEKEKEKEAAAPAKTKEAPPAKSG